MLILANPVINVARVTKFNSRLNNYAQNYSKYAVKISKELDINKNRIAQDKIYPSKLHITYTHTPMYHRLQNHHILIAKHHVLVLKHHEFLCMTMGQV